jgi:hypothetical protein
MNQTVVDFEKNWQKCNHQTVFMQQNPAQIVSELNVAQRVVEFGI